MNTLLKALLVETLNGISLAEDAIHKNYFSVMADVGKILFNSPAVIANISDLQAELKALPGSDQETDLISFIEAEFSEQFPNTKAQAILNLSLKLIQETINCIIDGIALKNAIQS